MNKSSDLITTGRRWRRLAGGLLAILLVGGLARVLMPASPISNSTEPASSGAPVPFRPPQSYFVSPQGVASNDGSRAHPIDLVTALSDHGPARPGDTIWLLEGVFPGSFAATISGAPTAPIYVKQFPGARVTLDGASSLASTLTVSGSDLWFWGFEIGNSDPVRVFDEALDGRSRRATAVTVTGTRVRFINLIVHDGMTGFSVSASAQDVEIYGCLIYNHGIRDNKGAYGDGIYLENGGGRSRIIDVLSFQNQGRGLTVVGQPGVNSEVILEGVALFENGIGDPIDTSRRAENLHVTGIDPSGKLKLIDSHLYQAPHATGQNVTLGDSAQPNGVAEVKGNRFIGGSVSLSMTNWARAAVSGNQWVTRGASNPSSDQTIVHLRAPQRQPYDWDANSYVDLTSRTRAFVFNQATNVYGGDNLSFGEWQMASALDRTSRYISDAVPGIEVHVRPNRYDPNRALVVIYTTHQPPDVTVPLDSGALKLKGRIDARNAQDYFGPSAAGGLDAGSPRAIRLAGLAVAPPVGSLQTPLHTAPEFAAFLLEAK